MLANNIKVGIFVPCCVDQFAAQSGLRMIKLLQDNGVECFYPTEITCCGKALFVNGDREGAKALGEKMIDTYSDYPYVVSCGSGCVAYIKKYFSQLFHNTTFHNSYRQFADKIYDISDFLVNVMHYTPTNVSFPHSVAFLDHCNTLRDYRCTAHPDKVGLSEEPRQLLRAIEGLKLVEIEQADVCCGYGGHFANMFTPISNSLAKRKIDNIMAAGAEVITSTETSCLLNLKSYIDKNGLKLKCVPFIDILQP